MVSTTTKMTRFATIHAQGGLQVGAHPGVLKVKVKVKGHVLRALLCWHENRFFSRANGRIATKLARDGLQVSLHPGCAQGQVKVKGHVVRTLMCWT